MLTCSLQPRPVRRETGELMQLGRVRVSGRMVSFALLAFVQTLVFSFPSGRFRSAAVAQSPDVNM